MMTFENWLETRQGKFFSDLHLKDEQDKEVEEGKRMVLKFIYHACKENQFGPIPGVMLKEFWKLQNKDGSMNIPT